MSAQSLRFLARPYDVQEGEAVVFSYLPEQSTVPLSSIKAWRWDFDGDVVDVNNASDPGWDQKKTVGGSVTADQINTTWTAVFNAAKGTGDPTLRRYTPKLHITTTANVGVANTTPGVTEDVTGLDGVADPTITVRKAGSTDDTVTINFYGNPRLARSINANPTHPDRTQEIKLFAEVSFKRGITGQILGYSWDFDAPETGDGGYEVQDQPKDSVVARISPDSSGADYIYPKPPDGGRSRYHVALKVRYSVDGGTPVWSQPFKQLDFLVIEDVPVNLSLGRAYRQGFPERYDWDDIVKTYSSPGANGNHVYFGYLEKAFDDQYAALQVQPTHVNPFLHDEARNMAEAVNELLQGQTLRGSQGMINALRIRYPRLVDPATIPARLPAPAGTREETAALETAALDMGQSVQFASFAVRAFGPGILRAGPDPAKPIPYPQFPQYVTFQDSTLAGAPIPIKNEYWQLSAAADGQAQARVEKAKLLWKHSLQDDTALGEAKEECKTVATQSYLTMALMANGQTETQFAQNEGGSLMAHVKTATDLFDKINAGVNPLGNDGSFIPNESFAAIYQDATEAVDDARSAEIQAREEQRLFDRNQADLRNELQNQRAAFITPLKLLTGIDPAQYNNLATVTDQKDFRNTFNSRLNNLLQNYPNADPTGLGEYGAQVAAILDAKLNIEEARTNLGNLYASIEYSRWANQEIQIVNGGAFAKNAQQAMNSDTATAIAAVFGNVNGVLAQQLLKAGLNSQSSAIPFLTLDVAKGVAGAVPLYGSPTQGALSAVERLINMLQNARIADIQLEAEIRKSLLQVANFSIAIRRAENQLTEAELRLDSLESQMDRYIEDLAHARDTAASLYFMDPSFRISASQAEKRAVAELDYAIDKLYRLAKTLEYEWTEPYRNPLVIPATSQEPPALTNTLFDKFTKLDSLFIVRSADEAKDYLDALKEWDSKLRRVNVTSVRGPNRSAPISAVPISLREHVLGLKPRTGYTLEQSISDFRNYLENNRVANFYNSANPTLEIRFPLGIEDNTYFPATGSRWNMRLASIAADLYAESGFSDQQVAEIDFIQSGMVTLRRYWANPPASDDLMKLSFNVDNLDRTVFATAFPAKINGATGGRPLTEFDNAGLAGRPVGTTEWILRINTENPANRNIDFTKLKDIVLRFTYTYGNAPEFPGF
ncbi:MAG: hypothetical protein J0M04_22930 [Verrucomicrobia bacterium]|nr:hypothetical protein [Verrucomicrobiota bacterium]